MDVKCETFIECFCVNHRKEINYHCNKIPGAPDYSRSYWKIDKTSYILKETSIQKMHYIHNALSIFVLVVFMLIYLFGFPTSVSQVCKIFHNFTLLRIIFFY